MSPALLANVTTLQTAVLQEVEASFQQEALQIKHAMHARGIGNSSMHMQALDRKAAEMMASRAETISRELLEAHAAEPAVDTAARVSQLTALLDSALERLEAALTEARDQRVSQIRSGGFNVNLTELPTKAALMRSTLGARLYVKAMAANNGAKTLTTTVNVSGNVGAIQTGEGASATVTQTVPPTGQDVLNALSQIEAALQASLQGEVVRNALELLADLRDQAAREAPNRLKVSSLLGGLATLIQTVPAAAPAWDTITRWASAVRSIAA